MFFFVVIGSSQAAHLFDVDLAATFFPEWQGDYGDHHIRAASSLAGLRPRDASLPSGDRLYAYDGTPEGAAAALESIGRELEGRGMRFFRETERRAIDDPVLQRGFRWIDENAHRLPHTLLNELDDALKAVNYATDRVSYALLDELKAELRVVAKDTHAPKRVRREIRVLGLHLLELAARTGRTLTPPPRR